MRSDCRDIILEGLADGKSLRAICREPDMPNIATIMRWLTDDREADFREHYTRAREAGDAAMAEDIQSIADDPEIKSEDKRVMVDVRKWLLAKRQPKKYGDRQALEHSGPNGGPIRTETEDVSKKSDDELRAIAAGK